MGILDGQVALVTGAGRGFGRAIAEQFAQEGAAVALLARSLAQLDEVAKAIRGAGGHAIGVRCDVTDAASVEHAVAKTGELLGPIDVLVNNAGVPGPFGPIWQVDPDDWWRAQAIHIRAPMLFMHHVLPGMVARDTAADPEARKYFQPLIERIENVAHAYGTDPDLARCAQRCVDLASGRYDALSGGYFELPDDLDAELAEKAVGSRQ